MDKKERRQRPEEARQDREREANLAALRQIRDNPNATPGERLEAIRLPLDLEGSTHCSAEYAREGPPVWAALSLLRTVQPNNGRTIFRKLNYPSRFQRAGDDLHR